MWHLLRKRKGVKLLIVTIHEEEDVVRDLKVGRIDMRRRIAAEYIECPARKIYFHKFIGSEE